METRELVYFVAVAEERHFGHAAARLGISQPPLSRAIGQLERRLGVILLRRTSRSVTLTPAGEMLLHEARKALHAMDAAIRRSQRAGREDPCLPVVMKPGGDGGLLSQILTEYEADSAAIPVEVLVCGIGEQATWLRDGRADVGFVHHPHDDLAGFDTEVLLTQRQVAVLPRSHRLAGHAAVTLDDLRDEPLPRWPGMHPDSTSGPEVRDIGQVMQLIALGRAVAILPESVLSRFGHDLVGVPVPEAPSTTVMIAWPERSHSLAVAAFVRAASTVAAHHHSPAAFGVPA
ncbi:MAG: LysR family transcriptional regulator [Pseudonocardiales bacterium]|nr:MAG: LysR family transcriptional regulator [Pseudonocardiales bacterium]